MKSLILDMMLRCSKCPMKSEAHAGAHFVPMLALFTWMKLSSLNTKLFSVSMGLRKVARILENTLSTDLFLALKKS